jgi:hypothetical protein
MELVVVTYLVSENAQGPGQKQTEIQAMLVVDPLAKHLNSCEGWIRMFPDLLRNRPLPRTHASIC